MAARKNILAFVQHELAVSPLLSLSLGTHSPISNLLLPPSLPAAALQSQSGRFNALVSCGVASRRLFFLVPFFSFQSPRESSPRIALSFKDGKALCGLLHQADGALFEWADVLASSAEENARRGLDGFEKSFQVPKLMDAEDINSVPDDKGMTLYLSYIVDILQVKSAKKQSPLKSRSMALRDPSRRQSVPNFAIPDATTVAAAEEPPAEKPKPKYGGGGYLNGASTTHVGRVPVRNSGAKSSEESKPVWAKRPVPAMDEPPKIVTPPTVIVPGPDPLFEVQQELKELAAALKQKEHECEALTENARLLEIQIATKDTERHDAEARLQRDILELKAVSAAASVSGNGDLEPAEAQQEVKSAMTELKRQVDDLEMENEMLQMSLEDSRRSQMQLAEETIRLGSEGGSGNLESHSMLALPTEEDTDDLEILAHQVREAEKRARYAEQALAEQSTSGSTSSRTERLRKQVGELEDRVIELERELRAAKRSAGKVERMQKELDEAEAREVVHSNEMRELRRKVITLQHEADETQSEAASGAVSPRLRKTNSRLERSPRQASIPKLTLDGEETTLVSSSLAEVDAPTAEAKSPRRTILSPRKERSAGRIKSPRTKAPAGGTTGKLNMSLFSKWEGGGE